MVVTWYTRKREINGKTEVRCAMFSTGARNTKLANYSSFFPRWTHFFLQSVIREQVDAVTFGEGQSDKSTETEEGLWVVWGEAKQESVYPLSQVFYSCRAFIKMLLSEESRGFSGLEYSDFVSKGQSAKSSNPMVKSRAGSQAPRSREKQSSGPPHLRAQLQHP